MDRHREVAEAFERVIEEIQELPEFSDFLRFLPAHMLASAAVGGPVVAVNVSRYGSHALILAHDGTVETVSLPSLAPDAVHERVTKFLAALGDLGSRNSGTDAETRMTDTLEWLWDALARPVLDRIGITDSPHSYQPKQRLKSLAACCSGISRTKP